MATLLKDLQFGLRTLRTNKGFTAVAALTMAVGIAANTTVFSWVNAALLRPFPATGDPAKLVSLETVTPSGEHIITSYPDFRDLRDRTRQFDGILASQPRSFTLGEGVHGDRVWGELVSGDYFDVMRVNPALGRFFVGQERDDTPGGHLVVVISDSFWKNRFHSSRDALGSTIHVNRYPLTVIGVAPVGFGGSLSSLAFDLWIPAMAFPELSGAGNGPLADRKNRMFLSLARLKPGVSMEQGRAELQSLSQRLAEAYPAADRGLRATIMPMWLAAYGAQKVLLAPLSILMGICAVVMLIACANVANLLLARATTRGKEFSVRLALGAPRRRLVRQLLIETLLLAIAGSLLGLVFADQMRASLSWMIPATSTPNLAEAPLDWRVLLFTEALALAVTLLAGLIPALQATHLNVNETLKESGRGGSGSAHSHRLRGVLVVAEVALAVVALAGAGLFLKSFQVARAISPGFDPRQVAVAEVDLAAAGYSAPQAAIFCRRLRQDLESQPGVEAVSFSDTLPLGFVGASWEDLQIDGYTPGPTENMKIYRSLVAPGYFGLLRIPLLEGRDFTGHDDENSPPAMIVNQEFVRRFLARRNPLGHKVNAFGKWFTIEGVVRDAKYLTFTESPQPYFYVPIRQQYMPDIKFYLRTAGTPERVSGMVRRAVAAIDPNVAVFRAEALSEHISEALYGHKIAASLLTVLGMIALLLSAVGLYSVMAYSVIQRTHEIGIRIALGARPVDMTWLALRRGMTLAAAGLAIGLLGAVALARMASAALVHVSPVDPAVYGVVAIFLALIAALASWIPARRAAQVDPMECLRVE